MNRESTDKFDLLLNTDVNIGDHNNINDERSSLDNRRRNNRQVVILPKATAMWLVDNTALTFQQIADFCNLHILEIVAMANGDHPSIQPVNPITNGQLTQDEIDLCTAESNRDLVGSNKYSALHFIADKKVRYISRRRRRDKPDAILWLLNNYTDFNVRDICKLINTTKNVVASIVDKTHWNYANLEAKSPVDLELCSQEDIDNIRIKKEIVKTRDEHMLSSDVS